MKIKPTQTWCEKSAHIEGAAEISAATTATTCSLLIEATGIIRDLLNAVPAGHCSDFHHDKKDRHEWGDVCPAEQRWRAKIKRAEDFVSSVNTGITR